MTWLSRSSSIETAVCQICHAVVRFVDCDRIHRAIGQGGLIHARPGWIGRRRARADPDIGVICTGPYKVSAGSGGQGTEETATRTIGGRASTTAAQIAADRRPVVSLIVCTINTV